MEHFGSREVQNKNVGSQMAKSECDNIGSLDIAR